MIEIGLKRKLTLHKFNNQYTLIAPTEINAVDAIFIENIWIEDI
jgi:hypothetical protein